MSNGLLNERFLGFCWGLIHDILFFAIFQTTFFVAFFVLLSSSFNDRVFYPQLFIKTYKL